MEYQGVPLSGLTEEEQQIFSDAKDYESLKRHNGYLKLRAWLNQRAANTFLALSESKSDDPKVTHELNRNWRVIHDFIADFDFEMERAIGIRDKFVEDYNLMEQDNFRTQQEAIASILS